MFIFHVSFPFFNNLKFSECVCFIFATGDALDAEKDEPCVPTAFLRISLGFHW